MVSFGGKVSLAGKKFYTWKSRACYWEVGIKSQLQIQLGDEAVAILKEAVLSPFFLFPFFFGYDLSFFLSLKKYQKIIKLYSPNKERVIM